MSWKLKTQNGQVGKPENKTLLKKRRRGRGERKCLIVKTNVVKLELLVRRMGPSVLSTHFQCSVQ